MMSALSLSVKPCATPRSKICGCPRRLIRSRPLPEGRRVAMSTATSKMSPQAAHELPIVPEPGTQAAQEFWSAINCPGGVAGLRAPEVLFPKLHEEAALSAKDFPSTSASQAGRANESHAMRPPWELPAPISHSSAAACRPGRNTHSGASATGVIGSMPVRCFSSSSTP